jgi:hypothetical protein
MQRGILGIAGMLAVAAALALAPAAEADWAKVPAGATSLNRSAAFSAQSTSLAGSGGLTYLSWDENNAGAHSQIHVDGLAADGSGWQPVGDSLNRDPNQNANVSELADVDGVPYIVWNEQLAGKGQVFVDRLGTDGTTWQPVGGSLNRSAAQDAIHPEIASVGGVPYVVWLESDGTHGQIYVDRLNAAGDGWDPVGVSLNRGPTRNAHSPTIEAVDGVAYVAWYEEVSGTFRVFVDRLDADGTTWDEIGIRLNHSSTSKAFNPSITSINGVPYVAFTEFETANEQAYVDRLDADGTTWDSVGGPLSRDQSDNSANAVITTVAGAPYVAWDESVGGKYQAEIDRLAADGTTWEPVGSGTLNDSTADDADVSSLETIGGVPYIGWSEGAGGGVRQIRVDRLEPEFGSTSANPTDRGATLTTEVKTYGIGYPIGFDYGASLEQSTTPALAPGGSDTATISQDIAGLKPSSLYSYRPFATAGIDQPRVLGPTAAFSTAADITPPTISIDKKPKNHVGGSRATYRFSSDDPDATFECKLDHHKYRGCDSPEKLKHLDPGKHKFKVTATDDSGNNSKPAKDKFKVV